MRCRLMAYSPIEQGRLPSNNALRGVAAAHGVTPYKVALAWAIRNGAIAIPKAATLDHVRQNRAAGDLILSDDERAQLDAVFAPPTRKGPLEML